MLPLSLDEGCGILTGLDYIFCGRIARFCNGLKAYSLSTVIGARPVVGRHVRIPIPFSSKPDALIVKGGRLVKVESFEATLFCVIPQNSLTHQKSSRLLLICAKKI